MIKIWDIQSTYSCIATIEEHGDSITKLKILKDKTTLISSSSDKTIKVWNIDNLK